MTLLLIIGLVLTGTAVALLARAIALPRIRSAERIQRIASYGGPEAEEVAYDEEGLSGRFDRIAERVGGALIPSLGGDDPEAVRTLLVSAGMYGISPGRFLGYRVFGAAGAGIAWLWLAPLSGVARDALLRRPAADGRHRLDPPARDGPHPRRSAPGRDRL